ncbi:hypothetical protein JL107_09755 [Nakamurella flavida]|uniref:ATP-citrate synthase/succinyl-CoA ligase C-terminal domain-containing protein n=1 Tax=Nakamurella flavida TaxID=363630 RepID=A0A939C0H5_9ACTN|nr:hypothetical protein [Nakamurella flavida]MBM9476728.1 hypothetical protein [Nakamurella flavida]MDP9778834.1 FdrA protein [Nakamurella flavida]
MTDHITLRRGVYHDSVTLLRISRAVADTPGVTAAQVAMATPLNVELAVQQGFSVPPAGPDDLLVAVRGDDDAVRAGLAALQDALAAADRASVGARGVGATPAPRTVRAATREAPDAAIVLLSVPGAAVTGEAMDAIAAGRHVMIFSDNVPLSDEIALKDAGARAGVLVMGPDCGTAVIGGVGLGFANVLRAPGSGGTAVGLVAASGTGAQQLSSLLDEAGVAVSHVLGVGGRDLSREVGGRSTLAALALLDADPATGHVVVLSKPPHPAVADTVRAAARSARTPVSTVLLGEGGDLTTAAEQVCAAVGVSVPDWPRWIPDGAPTPGSVRGVLRGLFAGGTLADEAMLVTGPVLGDIRSNIPLRPALALPVGAGAGRVPDLAGLGHVVLDLGDDAFTAGRPHPMIDPSVRLGQIAAAGADPAVGVLLVDVVLGHGADPDPAGSLAPALRTAVTARDATHPLTVVVSLCGTGGDPQDRGAQASALLEAGAAVFVSNAEAARYAAGLLAAPTPAGTPSEAP